MTGNYHIFDLSSGRVGPSAVNMKRGRYLGKLRSNFARTRHYMYARGPGGSVDKRENGIVVFDKPRMGGLSKAKEPRQMTVVLPSADARTRAPHAQRVAGKGTGLRNAGTVGSALLYGGEEEIRAAINGPDELIERLTSIENWRAWQESFPGHVGNAAEGKDADESEHVGKMRNPLRLGKFIPFVSAAGADDEEVYTPHGGTRAGKRGMLPAVQQSGMEAEQKRINGIAVLANAKPKRNRRGQYELKFKGRRGTKGFVESVKNVQLVADGARSSVFFDPQEGVVPLPCGGEGEEAQQGPILLQFGKVGKDRFVLDFCAPITPFQAFCVALSQFAY